MRIGKTLPPAAAPIFFSDILKGLCTLNDAGKSLNELRQSIMGYFGVKYCFLLSSGKAAISVSLKALSKLLPGRRQVIIPAFNCYSVPSAIVNAGFSVYPCDIDPHTLQIEPQSLKEALSHSDKILAIIPAHLFGLPAPIPWIYQKASAAGVPVIEDAAQAMGSRFEGKLLGAGADIGIFSLSRGKALSTGEGGIIITSRDDLAETIEEIVNSLPQPPIFQSLKIIIQNIALFLFIHPYLFWLPHSLPFLKLGETVFNSNFDVYQLGEFQAGTASAWITKLKHFLNERHIRNRFYSDNLHGVEGIVQITTLFPSSDLTGVRFPLQIIRKHHAEKILQICSEKGLGVSKTYPDIINHISELNISSELKCENAQSILKNLITLPSHPLVSFKDMETIVKIIKSVVSS